MANNNQQPKMPLDPDAAYEAELKSNIDGLKTAVAAESPAAKSVVTAGDKPTMSVKDALQSLDPEARRIVHDDCMQRNRHVKPPRMKATFEVESQVGTPPVLKTIRVEANDEVDAIAVANTELKISAGPHGRKVRRVESQLA